MDRRVGEILEQLERHWSRQVSVRELAASVNLGTSRLAHLMRSHARISIRELVRRRRMDAAAVLLVTTHQRISEIAYAVGFADVSNFNHAFRREHGVSPRAYRERERTAGAPPEAGETRG